MILFQYEHLIVKSMIFDFSVIQICLATAHPAKFSKAVETALKNAPQFNFDEILPPEFVGLLEKKRRVVRVEGADPGLVKEVIEREIRTEMS